MKTKEIPLEQRMIVSGDCGGLLFSHLSSDYQSIARQLYQKSKGGREQASITLNGMCSDDTLFSGELHTCLEVIKDLISGRPDENGRIQLNSGTGKMSVGFGGEVLDSYMIIDYVPEK